MTKYSLIILVLSLPLFLNAQWGGGEANPDLKTNAEALKEWQDLKFGLFVHWGPVSLRGTEIGWSRGREVPIDEYDNLYKDFNPVLFEAAKWVGMIKSAGMKYLIITSKHHDGFCIWDSEFTDYDIMSSPFKRDILRELSDECKRQGILFGTYHSIADWHHPHYTTRYGGDPRPVEDSDMKIYVEYLKNQVKELIEKYDIDVAWFDGEWEDAWTHEYGMELYKYIRGLKNDILINNRIDKGRQGMMGMTRSAEYAGDFATPEQEIGAFHPDIPWESCITICNQWAWKPNDQMKSLEECIQTLARTVGGGGNLLLNVGPMLDGRVEQRQIDRLAEMGSWLEKNGESIYGTAGGPFKPTEWMVSTHKDNQIFIHLFTMPDGQLVLPGLNKTKVLSARLLNGNALTFNQTKDNVIINLPDEPVDAINTVIVLELNKEAASLQPMDVAGFPQK
jgi:alpha-L-fucosidase